MKRALLSVAVLAVLMSAAPRASRAEDDANELAKKLNNPVASLISVPLQSNWHFGIGPDDATQYLLNIQPVFPATLNPKWNAITRVILPVLDTPIGNGQSKSGIGDVTASEFFS